MVMGVLSEWSSAKGLKDQKQRVAASDHNEHHHILHILYWSETCTTMRALIAHLH